LSVEFRERINQVVRAHRTGLPPQNRVENEKGKGVGVRSNRVKQCRIVLESQIPPKPHHRTHDNSLGALAAQRPIAPERDNAERIHRAAADFSGGGLGRVRW